MEKRTGLNFGPSIFVYLPLLISQILEFIHIERFLFWWRDSEKPSLCYSPTWFCSMRCGKKKEEKKYLHFAISWNILWRFWYLFQIFCSSELFCKSAWGMSFAFHEELHLKTLKVYNHPIEKCYNSVFQKQAPCKSDKKKVVLFIMLLETKLMLA